MIWRCRKKQSGNSGIGPKGKRKLHNQSKVTGDK